MKLSLSIMAHPERIVEAENLQIKLSSYPFYESSLTLDNGSGEWDTGKRALLSHTDSDWVILLQDDVIVSNNFYANALNAIQNIPEQTLLSFYTGTVRPFSGSFRQAVDNAESIKANYLMFPTLCWGVGFAIPTSHIDAMLDGVKYSRLPFDERIGNYYLRTGSKVYYTHPSIVDHNYKLGSLLNNDKSDEPRKARKYEPGLIRSWNGVVKV